MSLAGIKSSLIRAERYDGELHVVFRDTDFNDLACMIDVLTNKKNIEMHKISATKFLQALTKKEREQVHVGY